MMPSRRWTAFSLLVPGLLLLAAGCKSGGPQAGWTGLQDPVELSVQQWTYEGKPARKIMTPHYALNTTIQDNRFLDNTAQVMEGAYAQYLKLVPGLAVSDRPMDCFLFATRHEWEVFTIRNTGGLAQVYLRITRGGYAVRDWYVAYYMGDYSTFSVAAHEGWHQFCGRNFKGRLPPFLEEGIACMFEGVSLTGPHGLPRWNPAVNLNRAVRLREAVVERRLWPLDQLVALHAGMIVGDAANKIDSFYAQNWAFARFLVEGQKGKYRPALQNLLTDTARGQVFDPVVGGMRPAVWIPDRTKGILEHYLGVPFAQIEREYLEYVNVIAFDEFSSQWQS